MSTRSPPGLIHRYPDRVLLKLVQVCAVYCRFCFRRETVGPDAAHLSPEALDAALAYIAEHPEVWEVIVSGGDPLVASPRRIRGADGPALAGSTTSRSCASTPACRWWRRSGSPPTWSRR